MNFTDKEKSEVVYKFIDYYNEETDSSFTENDFKVSVESITDPDTHISYEYLGITAVDFDDNYIIADLYAATALARNVIEDIIKSNGIYNLLPWDKIDISQFIDNNGFRNIRAEVQDIFDRNISALDDSELLDEFKNAYFCEDHEDLVEILYDMSYFDKKAIYNYIINIDGRGSLLSSWDKEEIKLGRVDDKDYFAYRLFIG